MTHRIYYNFQWRGPVLVGDAFFDKLEEVGEIRTTAEGFSIFVPGDVFTQAHKTFARYNVPYTLEEAPASQSAWPLRHEDPPGDEAITPTFLECAYCHDVLTGNAAQIGVHLSEHLVEIADEAGVTR